MRIHKRIIVNQEEMEKDLFYRILVEGAKYLIEQYNFYKSKEIEFEFNWHQGVSRGGGYEHGSDLELMDNFFGHGTAVDQSGGLAESREAQLCGSECRRSHPEAA